MTPERMTPRAPERLALSMAEAGDLIGVSERTVQDLVTAGEIPHVRIGQRRVVLPVADLRSWLSANAEGGEKAGGDE